jgi:4-alpha-glucanotransferase
LELCDLLRIDHFRGFEACWEVPVDAETAQEGRWVPAPGDALFTALTERFGELPIVAEDLGVITPAVEDLRDRFRLPGMKVLQFAWSDPRSPYLPHNHRRNCVVYAGTHDNIPSRSWWENAADPGARDLLREYLGVEHGGGWESEAHWLLIRCGMMSVAHTFVATLQDVLGLGADARMNTPGQESGNWVWRAGTDLFTHAARQRLARLSWLYQRAPSAARRHSDDVNRLRDGDRVESEGDAPKEDPHWRHG